LTIPIRCGIIHICLLHKSVKSQPTGINFRNLHMINPYIGIVEDFGSPLLPRIEGLQRQTRLKGNFNDKADLPAKDSSAVARTRFQGAYGNCGWSRSIEAPAIERSS
jgi:hypothetical protein